MSKNTYNKRLDEAIDWLMEGKISKSQYLTVLEETKCPACKGDREIYNGVYLEACPKCEGSGINPDD